MQVIKQVVGTFLLQETRPVALLGAVTAITTGVDKGWFLASLCRSGERFECATAQGTVTLRMSFESAIRLAGVLLILISQRRTELSEDGKTVCGQLAITGGPGDKVITSTSPPVSPGIKFAVVDGRKNENGSTKSFLGRGLSEMRRRYDQARKKKRDRPKAF